jgi:hypothetical protein
MLAVPAAQALATPPQHAIQEEQQSSLPRCRHGSGPGSVGCHNLVDVKYISMPKDWGRQKHMDSMLNSVRHSYAGSDMIRSVEHFKAVTVHCPCHGDTPCPDKACTVSDRSSLSNATIRTLENINTRYEKGTRAGRIGCWASHYTALEEFVNADPAETAPLLLLLEDDVQLDGHLTSRRGNSDDDDEGSGNPGGLWTALHKEPSGAGTAFFEMLPRWLAELPDEWDVVRFSTWSNYCYEDLLKPAPAPRIFRARMRRILTKTCDGHNESWPGTGAEEAWGGKQFKTYMGTHANLLTRTGARNVLASMLGCGVRTQDYCGYPENIPNQGVISHPDAEFGGRPFRSYAIPTPSVMTGGYRTTIRRKYK